MPANSIAQVVLFCFLLIEAVIFDIRQRVIPGTLPFGILATALLTFSPIKLFGLVPAVVLLIAAYIEPGSMGGGDIKLTASSGLVLGFSRCYMGLGIALALLALFHLFSRNKERVDPLAPFLAVGFIAAYFLDIGGILI